MLQHSLGAAAAKAKVAGLVVAAAAVGSATAAVIAAPSVVSPAGDSSPVTASPSTSPTHDGPAGSRTASKASAGSVISSEAPRTCPDDVRNHGAYVSSVHPSAAATRAPSDAARSDCGKAPSTKGSEATDTHGHRSSRPEPKKVRGKAQH